MLAVASIVVAGEVTYVKPLAGQAVEAPNLYGNQFVKADADSGAVNPHATVVKCRGMNGLMPVVICVDSESAEAKEADLIRLDFTGKGKFNAEQVVPLKKASGNDQTEVWSIGPKMLDVKQADKVVPVWVSGQYVRYNQGAQRYISLSLVSAMEADVKFGDKNHRTRIIDATGNLKFTDAGKPVMQGTQAVWYTPGDTVVVDAGDNKFGKGMAKSFYGQPVFVDGQWHNVTLSADGAFVSAQPVKAEMATLQVSQPSWTMKLASAKYVLQLKGDKQSLTIPAGAYSILEYDTVSPDGSRLVGGVNPAGKSHAVDVAADRTTNLAIGAPLTAKIDAAVMGPDVQFSLNLVDVGQTKVATILGEGGKQPPAPKVTVVDGDGKTVYESTLEYG